MGDQELEAKLQLIRDTQDVRDHMGYMEEAWLLIALGRLSEGVEVARRAQQVWQRNRREQPSPYGGCTYWAPWIAEAAVALAEHNWTLAEKCSREVLADFDEQDSAYCLLELALQAQGRLGPGRVWRLSQDPARDLAEFDLRRYALQRLRQ